MVVLLSGVMMAEPAQSDKAQDATVTALALGHPYEVGQVVAVIGRVVKVWPQVEGLPPALQVRFMNFVQREGGSYVPIPVEIIRPTNEECPG